MDSLFSLDDQLAQYRAYHLNPTNVFIHMIFIPQIFFTSFIIVSYINFPQTEIKLSTIGAILYSTYYILLSPKMGLLSLPFIGITYLSAIYLESNYLMSTVLFYAIAVNVGAWAFQFFGHFTFEKKSPAVFDNLVQPLVLAPYFVLFELMFALGYEKDLEKSVNKKGKLLRRLLDHPGKAGKKLG
ncbi:unnamed protein product [Ambrosiozyma monospora]|uniref:Unnamed protein product n=1 Tax=Ambrosiozyma monospora TaxID=43982 RepID=A0ACB5T4C7_AMBMO|nr:unnamed protein product [Ambrosiozyma monospora]